MYENNVLDGNLSGEVQQVVSEEDLSQKEKVMKLVQHCEQFQQPVNSKALFQLFNTLVPFLITYVLMVYFYSQMYWVTALLTIPAAGFLVRIFIIQHDCGHGSFFKSRKWNNRVGRVMSLLTWTPYDFWRKTHNMHHSGSGNLDNRGFGAIETITVKEYGALDTRTQFWYRIYRNPYIMLLLGTPFFIIIGQRFPTAKPFPFSECKKHVEFSNIWKSVIGLNGALFAFYVPLSFVFGLGPILLTYLPIVFLTAIIGGWLFFIQHQFEDAYWERDGEWNYHEAAVLGSSYYDLHPILRWFTGNIGLHHIHHLNAKIPNYRLQECMDSNDELKTINRITFWQSFKYATLSLWDEEQNKMISF